MTDQTNIAADDSAQTKSDMPFRTGQDRSEFSSSRLDDADDAWPMRPWILAAICAAAGFSFYHLVEGVFGRSNEPANAGLAAFIMVASLSFSLGVERRRWTWAAVFSLFWGALIGVIMWRIARYSHDGGYADWPVFSAILAALVAAPFFQTRRDVAKDGRQWRLWQLPYVRLHDHAWTDAVLGAAGIAFAGISLLLMLLIGGMFDVIGIRFVSKLMNNGGFVMALAGAGFGGAVGLLRERDRLVSVMQRLVMVVLSVLAPVMAAAAVIFLLSLIGTGLAPLWSSGFSATVMMLLASAAAVLLANAVLGNEAEGVARNRILFYAAATLVAVVLPLAVIAAAAMGLRISQYGWTPDRLWGAVTVLVALAYGAGGFYAVVRGRGGFADWLRPLQQKLAILVMLIAIFLALPIVDFGGISARDQMARLERGTIAGKDFDWGAMAFDYGPTGRAKLQALVETKAGPEGVWGKSAKAALAAKTRWSSVNDVRVAVASPLAKRLRILPDGALLPDGAKAHIEKIRTCDSSYMCAVYVIGDNQLILLNQFSKDSMITQQELVRNMAGAWHNPSTNNGGRGSDGVADLQTAVIRLETVKRQTVTVNGVPQQLFE